MPDPDPRHWTGSSRALPPSAWSRQSWPTPAYPYSADPDPASKNNADPCRMRMRNPALH
jgi:hypothetical protein